MSGQAFRQAMVAALAGAPLVTRLDVVEETSSTMDLARDLVRDGAGPGLVVVAERQTRGRGRSDHAWCSPPGGLYLTIALERLSPEAGHRSLALPVVAAMAIRETLAARGIAARLKWPNDVLVLQRKIAGVLGEAFEKTLLLGIGVNVDTAESGLPADVRTIATSVRIATGAAADVASFARDLIDRLAIRLLRWRAGDASFVDEATGALILEHPVRWHAPAGRAHTGTPRGIASRGELIIDTETGPITASAGDLEILWPS